MDGVFGDVGEKKAIIFLIPNGSLRPCETGGDDLDLGSGGDELIQGGVGSFDRAGGGEGFLLAGGHRGDG